VRLRREGEKEKKRKRGKNESAIARIFIPSCYPPTCCTRPRVVSWVKGETKGKKKEESRGQKKTRPPTS